MKRENDLQDFKTVVTYSSLGIGITAGAFLLVRHFIKKTEKNSAEKNSASEGDPATYAKQLHLAFQNDNYFGWGTNLNLLMQVFIAIASKKEYVKVQSAYQKLYGKSMNADLESELSADEYNSVIRVLSAKV